MLEENEYVEITIKMQVKRELVEETRLEIETFFDDFFDKEDVKLIEFSEPK